MSRLYISGTHPRKIIPVIVEIITGIIYFFPVIFFSFPVIFFPLFLPGNWIWRERDARCLIPAVFSPKGRSGGRIGFKYTQLPTIIPP